MVDEGFQNEEEIQEDSYIPNNSESSKKDSLKGTRKYHSTVMKEGKRNNRARKIKESKSSKPKNRK